MGSVGFSGNSDSNYMKHTSTEGKGTIMKAKCRNTKRKIILVVVMVGVQSPSCGRLFAAPRTAAHQAFLSLAIYQSLPKHPGLFK